MKAFFIGVVATLVVQVGLLVTLISGGYFNISAAGHHDSLLGWTLHQVYESTLAERAGEIEVPADFATPQTILEGARHFDAMCRSCHTPPGKQRTAVHLGLSPPPPKLIELMDNRTPAEAYWVINHGVRMTGMPAFGTSHDASQLWALVAFIQDARSYTTSQYEIQVAKADTGVDDGHQHAHSNDPDPPLPSADEEAASEGETSEEPEAPTEATPEEVPQAPEHDHSDHDH